MVRHPRGRNLAVWIVGAIALLLGVYRSTRDTVQPHRVEPPRAESRTTPTPHVPVATPRTDAPSADAPPVDSRQSEKSGRYDLSAIRDADERARVREMLSLIERGGPFRYRQDGVVFQNRESRLPRHERGYYREYTVITPGAKTRGARRIVRGEAGETYYTRDHYRSFTRIG